MKLNYDGYLNEYVLWPEVDAINLEKDQPKISKEP